MNKFSFFFVVAVWHVDFWFEALNFYENFGSDVKGSTFAMIMDVRGIFQVRLKCRHKELLRNLIGWRMASNVNHKWFRDLRPRGPRDNRRKPQRGDLFLCRSINSPRVAATTYHWLIHPSEHKTTWIPLLKTSKRIYFSGKQRDSRLILGGDRQCASKYS